MSADQPQRVLRREDVGPPREVLLDDVVLGRPGELAGDLGGIEAGVLLLRGHLVHRQQPHRGGVDRHRRVHVGQRDLVEEPAHLAEVRHGHADLADLAAGQRAVRVVAGLGRQVEGDRQAGLALREVGAVERVGRRGGGVPGVRAHHPGLVLGRDPAGRSGEAVMGPSVGPRLPTRNRLGEWQIPREGQADAA